MLPTDLEPPPPEEEYPALAHNLFHGMVTFEHRGRFLLLEAKGPKASVSRGQGIMFDHLMRTGIFTVFVIWGSPGAPVRGQLWPAKPRPCDSAGLRRVVSGWYAVAP